MSDESFLNRRLKTRLYLMCPDLSDKVCDKQSDQKSRMDKGIKERDLKIQEKFLIQNVRREPKRRTWWHRYRANRPHVLSYKVLAGDQRVDTQCIGTYDVLPGAPGPAQSLIYVLWFLCLHFFLLLLFRLAVLEMLDFLGLLGLLEVLCLLELFHTPKYLCILSLTWAPSCLGGRENLSTNRRYSIFYYSLSTKCRRKVWR